MKLKRAIVFGIVGVLLGACGGGGSGSSDDAELPDGITARIGFDLAVVESGDLQSPSELPGAPELNAQPRNLVVSPGSTQSLSLAVDLDDGSSLSSLLARVVGSSQLFRIDMETPDSRSIQSRAMVATTLRKNISGDLRSTGYCIDIQAVDDAQRASKPERMCFVLPMNDPRGERPRANAGPDVIAEIGETVQLVGSGVSPGDSIDGFQWTQTGGPIVTSTGSDSSILSFVAPDVSAPTQLSFRLRVTDSADDTATDTVTVSIDPPSAENRPPLAEAGPRPRVEAGREGVLRGDDVDPDGVIVQRLWQQTDGPTVSLSGENTARARFIAPAFPEDTTLTFSYTVTDDDGAQASDTVFAIVFAQGADVNELPVANAGQDQNTTPGANTTLNGGGSSDPDGNIASFSWVQLSGPEVTLIDADTPTPDFVAPPNIGSVLEFLLSVTDNEGGTATDNVLVTVVEAQVPAPNANAGPDLTALPGALVTLDGSGSSHPGGDNLQFQWAQTGGPGVTLAGETTDTASFTAPQAAPGTILSFQLTVTDESQLTDSDAVNVTLGEPPQQATQIQFCCGDTQVAESVGMTAVAISINPPSDMAFTLPFSLSGTASQGSDYNLLTPSPLNIAAGADTANIQLNINDDGLSEGNQTVILTLGQPSAGELGNDTEVVLTIIDGGPSSQAMVYGVTEGNELVSFFATSPGTLESRVQIDPNDIIADPGDFPFASALDFRPATGQIYLLMSDGRLYTLNPVTGDAALDGRVPQAVRDADIRAMGFDPQTDLIRMVGSANGANFRISPDDASVVGTDTPANFAAGDPNSGNVQPTGLDYSGSVNGGGGRTLYFVEDIADALGRIGGLNDTSNSANNGQALTIANNAFNSPRALTVESNAPVGYTLRPGARADHTDLGMVNLQNGALTVIGEIGNEPERFVLLAISVMPE